MSQASSRARPPGSTFGPLLRRSPPLVQEGSRWDHTARERWQGLRVASPVSICSTPKFKHGVGGKKEQARREPLHMLRLDVLFDAD